MINCDINEITSENLSRARRKMLHYAAQSLDATKSDILKKSLFQFQNFVRELNHPERRLTLKKTEMHKDLIQYIRDNGERAHDAKRMEITIRRLMTAANIKVLSKLNFDFDLLAENADILTPPQRSLLGTSLHYANLWLNLE